jgi:hypothetical protein
MMTLGKTTTLAAWKIITNSKLLAFFSLYLLIANEIIRDSHYYTEHELFKFFVSGWKRAQWKAYEMVAQGIDVEGEEKDLLRYPPDRFPSSDDMDYIAINFEVEENLRTFEKRRKVAWLKNPKQNPENNNSFCVPVFPLPPAVCAALQKDLKEGKIQREKKKVCCVTSINLCCTNMKDYIF